MRRFLARIMISALGRRNVVRLARLLQNEARLDLPNDMPVNGELMVQRCALNYVLPTERVTIADIGANVGDWSWALLAQAGIANIGSLSIHAFEPDHTAAARFRANTPPQLDGVTIEFNQTGVSHQSGNGTLYLAGPAAGTNSLHPPAATTTTPPTASAKLTTLDAYAEEKQIDHFVLVKVDTEGHDFRVIQGAEGLLRSQSIDVLQFEYNHRWIASRCFLRDVFDLMRPIGYQLGKVTPKAIEFYDGWDPELETYREANYVACRPEWRGAFKAIEWWNSC